MLAYSADGTALYAVIRSVTANGALVTNHLRRWQLDDLRRGAAAGEDLVDLGDENTSDLAVGPDGRIATAGDRRTVRLWGPSTGAMVTEFAVHPTTVFGLEISPDGRVLASWSAGESRVRLWDIEQQTLTAVLDAPVGVVNEVRFLPGATPRLVTGHRSGAVGLWDLRTDTAFDEICATLSGPALASEWRSMGIDPARAPCRA